MITHPRRAKLLSSTWSYRRKRLPNGDLLKHKARICVNGKEQVFGRDYWERYAPVASWATIHMLLVLSSIMNLKPGRWTVHKPFHMLEDPVSLRVPQGWYIEHGRLKQHFNPKFNDVSHYMRLKRNLYGCKQAAHNWFKHLTKGLIQRGFTHSKTDQCLFLGKDCILVVYVDDCLLFAGDSTVIDKLIRDLSTSILLQDEGDVNAFLGVQINEDPVTHTITFTLPSLLQQVLHDVGIRANSNGKDTPADSILHADPNGPDRVETWNYRSVIGKLNYLANNTRPDISMAVHQCARYCSNP
jgi:hypothetical protein